MLEETKKYLHYISILFEYSLSTKEIEELSLIESKVKYLTHCFSESEIGYIDELITKYKVKNAQ